jgi:hypothetical protein
MNPRLNMKPTYQKKTISILLFCIIAFFLYGIFNIVAMFFYAGGTGVEPGSSGYRFFENFYSDLGMIKSYNGHTNITSALLFSSALVLMGISLILFFWRMKDFFDFTSKAKIINRAGLVFGILSGLFCGGIGLVPQDQLPNLHMIMAYCFSGTFLFAIILFTIGIYLNRTYPNLYAVFNIIYMIILIAFIVLLSACPGPQTKAGLIILATGQKITIYSGMICVFIQFVGAFRYLQKNM